MNMKRTTTVMLMALFAAVVCLAQTHEGWKALKSDVNFFLVNDMGRNGYYDQKPIAALMGDMADEIDRKSVV